MYRARAWEETRHIFDWSNKGQSLLWYFSAATSSILLGWGYLWLFGEGKAVLGEMNTVTAYAAGLISTAIGVFVVNFLRAPFLIVREKDQAIRRLADDITVLEGKLKPVISVLYEGNKTAPYYHTDEGEHFKLLRIGIRNDGYTYLEGVRAKLTGVKQLKEDTAEPLFTGKFPAALHVKGDNPPDRSVKEFVKEFSINARSTEYIDVAQWVYNTAVNDMPWVQFMWAEQPHPLNGPFGHYDYELDIQVTTRGGEGISKKYVTRIKPFRLEDVTPSL